MMILFYKKTKKKIFELNEEQSNALKFLKKLMINLMYLFYKVQLVQEKHLYILRELKNYCKKIIKL